jgi:hypothetical protein
VGRNKPLILNIFNIETIFITINQDQTAEGTSERPQQFDPISPPKETQKSPENFTLCETVSGFYTFRESHRYKIADFFSPTLVVLKKDGIFATLLEKALL